MLVSRSVTCHVRRHAHAALRWGGYCPRGEGGGGAAGRGGAGEEV